MSRYGEKKLAVQEPFQPKVELEFARSGLEMLSIMLVTYVDQIQGLRMQRS